MAYRKDEDLVGVKFGRWTVTSLAVYGTRKSWNCTCDCGTERTVLNSTLKRSISKSCGCLKKELVAERSTTHGQSSHPYFNNFAHMKDRCFNPESGSYKYYGAVGVTVDPDILDFKDFLKAIGDKPNNDELWTVGRLDNNLPYSSGNIRWENQATQARNRTMLSSNKSGITGVFLSCDLGLNGIYYERWVGKYTTLEGKQKKKGFSVKKYGFEEAKALAISFRGKGMELLEQEGAGYGEKHGMKREI